MPRMLKFVLGILRHPSQTWHRSREMIRIAFAPPMSKRISADSLPDVTVIPVDASDGLGEHLVDIYKRNPSPYVHGPTSTEQLDQRIRTGLRHFLVVNENGDFVGARAFDPATKLLLNTVTVFRFRGGGYQISASQKMRELLANEGYQEFRCAIFAKNTRVHRALITAGWGVVPDPENPDLLRGTLHVDESGIVIRNV